MKGATYKSGYYVLGAFALPLPSWAESEDSMLYEARVFTSYGEIWTNLAFNKASFNKCFGVIFGHAVDGGSTITRAECHFLTEEEARKKYPWFFE